MQLYPHQREGLRKALPALREYGGFYLVWDPGCGKTLAALLIAKKLEAQRILVVTVVPGVGVWPRQAKQWWGAKAIVLSRKGTVKRHSGTNVATVAVTNYEQIRGKLGLPLVHKLCRWKPQLVIVDEGQMVKSPSAQNTKAMRTIINAARASGGYVLFLSGTPAHNPLDWHPQYNMIAPHDPMWGQTFTSYKSQIAIQSPYHPGIEGFRPAYKSSAIEAMQKYTHVASADELDLPEPIVTPVPFDLSRSEQRVYDEMEAHLEAELDAGGITDAPIVLTKYLRLHQITGGHTTDTDGQRVAVGTSKLDVLTALLEERSNKKVVVACRFRWEIEQICQYLSSTRRSYRVIQGGTKDRSEIEQYFQTASEPVVLILQYKSGGTALTLTAASALIFYSFEPSVIAFRQMWGRVFRIGTTTHVQILPVLASGTIDESLWTGLNAGLDAVNLAKFIRRKAA
jgi:SNF2 family DNA or RNA helicase